MVEHADWCPAGWSASDSQPSCNYTGGHYCIRDVGHNMPHRCACGATTASKKAMPSEGGDG